LRVKKFESLGPVFFPSEGKAAEDPKHPPAHQTSQQTAHQHWLFVCQACTQLDWSDAVVALSAVDATLGYRLDASGKFPLKVYYNWMPEHGDAEDELVHDIVDRDLLDQQRE
jgi:hypothetical protein